MACPMRGVLAAVSALIAVSLALYSLRPSAEDSKCQRKSVSDFWVGVSPPIRFQKFFGLTNYVWRCRSLAKTSSPQTVAGG